MSGSVSSFRTGLEEARPKMAVVRLHYGDVVMQGSEGSRLAAKYKADRALFLLLLSPRSPAYIRGLEPLKHVAPVHKK
jgi:hypothetical protein